MAVFFLHPVYGFEGFDECGELKKEIKAQQFDLELDTAPLVTYTSLGVEVDYNEGQPFIEKVHPDIKFENNYEWQDEDKKLYSDELESEDITHINGVEVESLNEEEFYALFELSAPEIYNGENEDVVKITLAHNNKTYHLKFDDYDSLDVYISPNIENIFEINSKDGSFNTKLQVLAAWYDYRLSKIASRINQRGWGQSEESELGFYCDIEVEFLKDINYWIPEVYLGGLIESESPSDRRQDPKARLVYRGPSECEDFGCTDEESEYGLVELQIRQALEGQVINSYDLKNFPFDTQEILFEFMMGNDLYSTNMIMSGLGDANLDKNFYNLLHPEWMVNNFDYWYGHHYRADWDVRVPYLVVGFEYERKTQYYLFKIMFPVIFLVLISWSVFWLHPKQLESRVTVSVICLLSLIAYNFVIDQDLPKLGYLTFLDGFIFISYLFAGFPTLETILCRRLYDRNKVEISEKLDRYCQKLLPFLYMFVLLVLTLSYGIE